MTPGKFTHEAVGGVAWQAFAILANVVVRTIVLIILTRTLTPKDFGLIAAALVVVTITTMLSEVGVSRVLIQRLQLPKALERSAFAISLHLSVIGAAAVFYFAEAISALFQIPELVPFIQFLSVVLIVSSISAVAQALTQRERKFRAMGLIELISFLTGYGLVALLLAHWGFGAWSLAIGHMVQCICKLIGYWWARPPAIGFLPGEGSKELVTTGAGFMFGQAGNMLARQIDYLIVGRTLGAVSLGYYNRAFQFLMLPAQLFGTAASKVLFPSMASIQDDIDRVGRAYTRAIGVIAMLTLPLSGFLIIIGAELVLVLFGETWEAMIVPFQILITSLLFRTSYKISDSVSLALGSMYRRAFRQWIYAAAVAVGAYYGSNWGLSGVAFGVSLGVMLNFLIMTHLAMKLTKIPGMMVLKIHLRHLAISFLYNIPILLVAELARNAGWNNMAILAVTTTAAIAYAGLLWFGFRRLFGSDGIWLQSILVSRLPFLRRFGITE